MRDFRPLRDLDEGDVLAAVAALPEVTLERIGVVDVAPEAFKRAMWELCRRPTSDPVRVEAERLWRASIPDMKRASQVVFDTVESREIDLALDAGAARIISDGTRFEDPVDSQVAWFRMRLLGAFEDPSSHVLVDEQAMGLLRSSRSSAACRDAIAETRSRRLALGTGLIERLPTFPDAPMSHILEAREELAEGRVQYRVSMKKMADGLGSAAFEPALSSEIDELWHDEVAPTLESLRATVSGTRVARETAKRLATEGFGLPTLAVGVASFLDLVDSLPSPTALVAAGGRVAIAGLTEAMKARAAARSHDLVYLLDLDKNLERAHSASPHEYTRW